MKDSFIKSTLILIIGGFITKILGMAIKIINTRLIGLQGISLYMLVFPTLSLFTSIAQFSMVTSISKLIGEDKYNNKKIITSSIFIVLIINILLIISIFLLAPFISNNLLKDKNTYLPILCIMFVLPFESISAIIRGYVFGKNKMTYHVTSHIIEQLVRLTLSILIIPCLININIIYAVSFLVIVNMFSELASILVMICLIPKHNTITKKDFIPSKYNIKNILNIAVPNTSTRIFGNISYFLEPILFTSGMLKCGYSLNYISTSYGIISGYIFPILLLPSFFTSAISSSLMPLVSNMYAKRNIDGIKKKLKQALFFSLLIGIPITFFFFLFPNFTLNLIYNTTLGSNYLKILAFPFLMYYIELPLSAILQAINKSKKVMLDNLIGITFKTILLYILASLNFNIYSLIIASTINIFIVTIRHALGIIKCFKFR